MTDDPRDDRHDREEDSPRQRARQARRTAGERSASTARTLMQLPPADLARLGLDAELREEVDRARAVTSHVARRRAERHLAGLLRQADAPALEARLANLNQASRADARGFQLAESWRARLIDGDASAEDFCAAVPGADPAGLAAQIADARRERTTGKPRGAARALFRLVIAALRDRADG